MSRTAVFKQCTFAGQQAQTMGRRREKILPRGRTTKNVRAYTGVCTERLLMGWVFLVGLQISVT